MSKVSDMTEKQIVNEINALGALADTRYDDLCDNAPALAGITFRHQMLDEQEKTRLHDLKIALNLRFGHLYTPEAAHNRIMQRIAMRNDQNRRVS